MTIIGGGPVGASTCRGSSTLRNETTPSSMARIWISSIARQFRAGLGVGCGLHAPHYALFGRMRPPRDGRTMAKALSDDSGTDAGPSTGRA
nr:FAD-binding oxidoreductase [Agrobacterium fabrum]